MNTQKMNTEKRCPYCWDESDPLDQGGNAAAGYDSQLSCCETHRERKDITPYLHLWDEAKNLDLGEFKTDWKFSKKIHSIFFDAFALLLDEFQWSCAEKISNTELKRTADQLVETYKNWAAMEEGGSAKEMFQKTLRQILNIKENSREDNYLKLVIEYYLLFLSKVGLARQEGRKMRPFRSFELHLLHKEVMQQDWDAIIYTGEYE